jgi:hypothetical protein
MNMADGNASASILARQWPATGTSNTDPHPSIGSTCARSEAATTYDVFNEVGYRDNDLRVNEQARLASCSTSTVGV